MNSRDSILTRLRQTQPAPRELPRVPLYDDRLPPALGGFRQALGRLGGDWREYPEDADLEGLIRTLHPAASVICSATSEVHGNRRIEDIACPQELADVDVGVVRPAFAVAETGSIWLSEHEYRVNALGYLPQHLVALLDPDQIVGNLHHAYRRRDFFEARYAVLMSGPSATADIEGVLVRGAQGIRSLTVVPVRQPRVAS